VSNQNRQWRPIPAGDWEIAALQETVMAFERSQDVSLVTQYLTAIACLEEIARRALPAESDGWRRLEHLRERVQSVVSR
jgi:hypothetical protein